jgi:hypothetical protein
MFSTCAKWAISATEQTCAEWAGLPPLSAEGISAILGAMMSVLVVLWIARRIFRYLEGPQS